MTTVDQFESVFKAAAKEVFRPVPVPLKRVLCVTDLDRDGANRFADHVRGLLKNVMSHDAEVSAFDQSDYNDVDTLLKRVDDTAADLVVTYRNLKSDDYRWPYSLGIFLNVLTREVPPAVLVVPHPLLDREYTWTGKNTDRVMVVTDHIAGDARLVSFGLRFTENGGRLFLTHIEDDHAFAHYIDAISKIPELNTDEAERLLKERLLKEPRDYIRSCRAGVEEAGRGVRVEEIVRMGHKVQDYRALVEEHQIDLLVFHTKGDDEERIALQGVAYHLAVELRQLPLLMI